VGANATSNAVCAGGSVTLTGTGANTYTWASPVIDGVAFVPASTATYTVTGTDANGCSDTSSILVTVNSLPTVTVNLTFSPICFDDANAVLTGAPSGGNWSGNGVTGNAFDPSVAGNGTHAIMYTYTDANGCTDSASQNVSVDPCVGIADSQIEEMFVLYPNPNTGTFNLQISNDASDVLIEMVDVNGRIVYTRIENSVIAGQPLQIVTENLAAGLYTVRVTVKGNSSAVRMSVVH
jgi:hypothetical protein